MEVTPACYAHFVHSLRQLANGRLAVVLEVGDFGKNIHHHWILALKCAPYYHSGWLLFEIVS